MFANNQTPSTILKQKAAQKGLQALQKRRNKFKFASNQQPIEPQLICLLKTG